MENLLEPTPDLAWVLAAEGFDALREAIYESRFSISNGFLGLRAGRAVSRGERWGVPHRAYVVSSAANPADERVSIGARGLTGDDYHGRVPDR